MTLTLPPLAAFDDEKRLFHRASLIIGVDEAGRGPLAGPVSAAACFIPPGLLPRFSEVNDSKKLSEKKRETIYDLALRSNLPHAVALVTSREIDAMNILEASLTAMRRAVDELSARFSTPKPLVLIDGNQKIKHFPLAQETVVGGDAKSLSIALASVLAKVTRDRYMRELDIKYPVYGFAKHKGYGTKTHLQAISAHGPCPEHRMTFAPLNNAKLFDD
jgi:ribonuclease HII